LLMEQGKVALSFKKKNIQTFKVYNVKS
jgi:hypothetical protein